MFATAALLAAAPNGTEMLARAAADPGLASYSVPVHFDVHMRRPVGVRSGVDGVASFSEPAQASIAITHIPGPLGGFFKGSYTLDMVPQTWPGKYDVASVTETQANGSALYLLRAVPKNDPSVDHVVFGVTDSYQPVSAQWYYKDGSSIELTISNQRVQGFVLPQSETISVNMPKYSFDATATYGQYSIDR